MVHFYIMVGNELAWKSAFKKNLWGFSERTKGLWRTIEPEDFVAFYVTYPIKKIIGFGNIEKKFVSETLFWPDEMIFKRCLWPYRIQFTILHVINKWHDGIKVNRIILNQGRKKISENEFESFLMEAEKLWKVKIHSVFKPVKQ